MTDRFLRLSAVLARTGLSRSSLYEQMKKGCFPRPVQLGPRAVGWLSSDVDTWSTRIASNRKAWIPPEFDKKESHEAHVA